METKEAIEHRYSCREFLEKSVEKEKLEVILQAAYAAPVACRRYDHVHLSVIQNKSYLARWNQASAVYVGNPMARPLYGAPVVILVSVFVSEVVPAANPYFNAGCVIENMALAATDLGLGNVILGAPVRAIKQDLELCSALGLPDAFMPALALAVGWPAAAEKGRNVECRTLAVRWME